MRVLGSFVVALLGADAARVQRAKQRSGAKAIAGVPILNYWETRSALVEESAEEDWVVMVKPGVTDDEVRSLCGGKCLRQGHPQRGGVPYFSVRASEAELSAMIEKDATFLKFVERDVQLHMFGAESGAQEASASWGLDRVGAPQSATDGAGSNVYILDTGIRITHTDYGGRAKSALDMTTGKTTVCNGGSGCAGDKQGHGSHCAGTVAGASYGVAPGANLFAIKVLSDSGSGEFSWSVDALDWLAGSGARPTVASMSLGGKGIVASMEAAVDAAVGAGVTVVVAGGNSNDDACKYSPAYVASAITVGSTDSNDARSYFSNYGSCTDIWAPGSDITSCGIKNDKDSQTYSGTSMACPHVSGASAVVLSQNTGLSPAGVLNELLKKSEKGAISDLKDGDVNKFLWISKKAAPVPAPTPEPVAPKCPPQCSSWACRFYSECAGCC